MSEGNLQSAFSEFISLTAVNLPDSISRVCERAFYRCNSLRFIKIHRLFKYIDSGTLDLSALGEITIDEDNQLNVLVDNMLLNKEMTNLLRYPIWKCDEVYIIPVTVIRRSAFRGKTHLKEVIISNGVPILGTKHLKIANIWKSLPYL